MSSARIEDDIRELQEARQAESRKGVALSEIAMDTPLYGSSTDGYRREIVDEEEEEHDQQTNGHLHPATRFSAEIAQEGEDVDPFAAHRQAIGKQTIAERESDYQAQRHKLQLSPQRGDVFSDETPVRSYKSIMLNQNLDRERDEVLKQIAQGEEPAQKRGRWDAGNGVSALSTKENEAVFDATPGRFDATPGRFDATPGRFDATPGRFDATPGRFDATPGRFDATPGRFDATPGRFDATPGRFDATPGRFDATPGRFDATPGRFDATPGRFDATPGRFDATPGRFDATPGRFDATPGRFDVSPGRENKFEATPFSSTPARFGEETPSRFSSTPSRTNGKTSQWSETPSRMAVESNKRWDATPLAVTDKTPQQRSRWDETPVAGSNIEATPTPAAFAALDPSRIGPITPEMAQRMRYEREMYERNRYLTDEELDTMLPASGYRILEPPAGYAPINTPSRKLAATPTPQAGALNGFSIAATPLGGMASSGTGSDPLGGIIPVGAAEADLPSIKPEDYQYFSKLMEEIDEANLSAADARDLKIMRLLLKIKNGTPSQRKSALRQITEKAREFGAEKLFNQILPLLMSPTLEDQERHLLVKVIDRVLYKLDDLVRPFVHKILVVIEPLLIDESFFARVEGREIIANLSKAAGLATMIATMRPDIDNLDEYVRNTTARAFAVVASALGIPALLPFLKAVCQSRKSWQARHTGIKIIQQIAILVGVAVLPHLRQMVEIIDHGLVDDQQKVRTITALALAALAEAAYPYGIESFDSVLKPLWKGIRHHRGKGLAAFLKAIGFIIPLMDANYANYYTREVMLIIVREFQSPDEEMKKIVLKCVKQCIATDGVSVEYVRNEILPDFFRNFWVRRMALDRRNYKQVVETTVELSNRVGAAEIIGRICDDLKDESEPYRRMVMETIQFVVQEQGTTEIDDRLEEQLIDGILYAFQEQASDDTEAMLSGFGVVINALGLRTKPYLPQICGTIKWRLNNKSASVRMQAADLIARIAVVMKTCDEEQLLGHLAVVLYEYLGEEYPEVLGSILGGLKAIVNVIGMTRMTPPIKDLLPRLTPILKNRHEKVQENCIAAGTPILMADGTSKPIEEVGVGDYVASPEPTSDGVMTRPRNIVTRTIDNGMRDCLLLQFEDGRRLECTRDHRILLADGTWIEAGAIDIGAHVTVSTKLCPIIQSVSVSDRAWSLPLSGIVLSLNDPASVARTLAFARLLGYLIGGGALGFYKGNARAMFSLGQQCDVDDLVADLKLVDPDEVPRIVRPKRMRDDEESGVDEEDGAALIKMLDGGADGRNKMTVNQANGCFQVYSHQRMYRIFVSVPGIMVGDCMDHEIRLPSLLSAADTPIPIVREFLAGLFGAGGKAAALLNDDNLKKTSSSSHHVELMRSCKTTKKDARAMMDFMETIQAALSRCGVNIENACLTQRHSKCEYGHPDLSDEMRRITRLMLVDSLSFAENIGFRYAAQKDARLGAVYLYFTKLRRSSDQRKQRVALTTLNLKDKEKNSQSTKTYHTSRLGARKMCEAETAFLHDSSNVESNSSKPLTPKNAMTSRISIVRSAECLDKYKLMANVGARSCFTVGDLTAQFARHQPTLQLKVVDRREIGPKRVYDLTVPGCHAFYANSVAAHNCIDLVGRIADRGAEFVSAREWMRICFELLEMLKAHKKAIRRAAVNTFGYIAKAIGPQDVLHTLLNNLKVQERQNRVCTTVAIGIVAETCAPFTVLPALMNEYRVPDLNVQNGVLKALSFMFEYIGEMSKDYVYAVVPLLEDALMDRDLVHRQTAAACIRHLALGVAGLGCEDALLHLMNFIWPNIFEVSPHVIAAVFEAIEAFIVSLGVATVLPYVLTGLYHPARRVRDVYWKIYNSLYIYGADALTSCYPNLESDGINTYRRTQLEIFL